MGHVIHRKDDQYRLWSTFTDTYITEPMSRDEMAEHIKTEALLALHESISSDTEARLTRVDKKGTSSMVGGARDTTKWNIEMCQQCGSFHHPFECRPSDGKCGYCGEPVDDEGHLPPCPGTNTP
jgi:rubrerythrin